MLTSKGIQKYILIKAHFPYGFTHFMLSQILVSLRTGTFAESSNSYVKHHKCSRNENSELIYATIKS